ncbi:hypothetical protein GT348_07170 [Aristophania vespae]|uniref:DUF1311 domain-containing protein n=1 Tax=Aristophania vespae TaxID=2697033 RepID=A0A6P1NFH0_9PROT|nr:hypothetical protein [Aristophania vespae]QHI96043.1 hypothetical protein GT348_07170 [Aristophania vespae]
MLKLVKTIFGSAALIYCVSAHAKPFTNEDAIKEAKTYEFYCGDTHTKSECAEAQENFIQDYQNAYAGDYASVTRVADTLWEYRDRSDIVPAMIEACSWQYVVMSYDLKKLPKKDGENMIKICAPAMGKGTKSGLKFSPTRNRLIHARALDIVNIIGAHTVDAVDSDSDE